MNRCTRVLLALMLASLLALVAAPPVAGEETESNAAESIEVVGGMPDTANFAPFAMALCLEPCFTETGSFEPSKAMNSGVSGEDGFFSASMT